MLFALLAILGIGFSQCLTQEELDSAGITPARRNGPPIRPAFQNWEMPRLISSIAKIILEEAMGYELDDYTQYDSAGTWFQNLLDGVSAGDFLLEVWTYSRTQAIQDTSIDDDITTDLSSIGYNGYIGWYNPGYMQNGTNKNGWDLAYFETYRDAAVIEHMQINLTEFILSDPELHADMSMSEPIRTFTPPYCEDNPCFDVINVAANWDTNFFEAQIRNLNMPFRLTNWGYGGWLKLTTALHAAKKDFVLYMWEPDYHILRINAAPIMFPKPNDWCLSNINTNNTMGLYSSVNCDFPRQNLNKFIQTKSFTHDANEEAKMFLSRLTITKADTFWLLDRTSVKNPHYTEDNLDYEAIGCEWVRDNIDTWKIWVNNEYEYAEKLSAEQIAMYVVGSIMVVLGVLFVCWKLGFMDSLEAVLFDIVIVYCGKIIMDAFDLMSDMMSYFTAVNGNPLVPMWYNICYCLIVGASVVVGVAAMLSNARTAWGAWKQSKIVEEQGASDQDMMKIRARSSLWQGAQGRPRDSDLHMDEQLEDIWCQEELEFASKRINDCYLGFGIAVSEDIPMLVLNTWLIMNYPDSVGLFVYTSLFLSIFFLGMRLNQFYKIIIYRQQYEYAAKARQIHKRHHEIQADIAKIGQKARTKTKPKINII